MLKLRWRTQGAPGPGGVRAAANRNQISRPTIRCLLRGLQDFAQRWRMRLAMNGFFPTARRSAGLRVLLALLLTAAAACLLWLRVSSTLTAPGGGLLSLGSDVPLSPPPPLRDDREAVRQRLSEVARGVRDSGRAVRTAGELAALAHRAGDPLTALLAYRRALAASPEDPRLLHGCARCEAYLGLYAQALESASRQIAADPRNPSGSIVKARALVALDRRDEAARALANAEAAASEAGPAALLALAREHEERGDLGRALALASQAAAASPEVSRAALDRAELLFKLNRFEEARPVLERHAMADPANGEARRYLAALLMSPANPRRDLRRAEHWLVEAIQQNPDDVAALQMLGELCGDSNRPRQAAYVFRLILEKEPDRASARLQLARALARLGDPGAAREQAALAGRLLQRDQREARLVAMRSQRPGDFATRLALGRHYLHWRQFGKALPELEAAHALAPERSEVRAELSRFFAAVGVRAPEWLRRARR